MNKVVYSTVVIFKVYLDELWTKDFLGEDDGNHAKNTDDKRFFKHLILIITDLRFKFSITYKKLL